MASRGWLAWLNSGKRGLQVTAHGQRLAQYPGNALPSPTWCFYLTALNRGPAHLTLTRCGIHGFANRLHRLVNYKPVEWRPEECLAGCSMPLPWKLERGETWFGYLPQDGKLNEYLFTGVYFATLEAEELKAPVIVPVQWQ